MKNSKKQIKTDATMASIVEANAVQIFEENNESVPCGEEKVLSAEAPISDRRLHVDDQGFLTTKSSVRSKRRK